MRIESLSYEMYGPGAMAVSLMAGERFKLPLSYLEMSMCMYRAVLMVYMFDL